MDKTLRTKTDHTIEEEFFHDMLDEHFTEEEVQRQLETALNWGRYAELFDYDSETGRLVLTDSGTAEPKGSTGS
jgi:NitT/TauT family transport system ATP-binding protein